MTTLPCRPECVLSTGMDVDEPRHALGGVVLASAYPHGSRGIGADE